MSTFVVVVSGVLLAAGLCPAADWPQFMGPDRNGKSTETGLLKSWPTGGPRLLWSADGHGIGYGSAAVADGAVYLTGMVGNEGVLFCYDTGGNLRYKVPYGPEWTRSYKGARATPTVDGPRLYIFSGMGVLSCHDVKTGERIWAVDTLKEFEGNNIRWGMVCSPLIDGDKVYVTPGGRKGLMAALDKRTGETVWATSGYEENPAYSSPILVRELQVAGRQLADAQRATRNAVTDGGGLLVTMMERLVIGVDAKTGLLRWKYPYPASYGTSAVTPVVAGDRIFVASVIEHEYVLGGTQLRLTADGGGVERVWNQPVLDTHHGGLVLVDGFLYGSTFESTTKGSWACVEWDTGKLMYDADWNGNKGSLIYADGMLYCYEEETGNLALVRATPEKFDIVSSFTITQGSGKHWAHPSIADGVLYIRHGEVLMAFDIKGQGSGARGQGPEGGSLIPGPWSLIPVRGAEAETLVRAANFTVPPATGPVTYIELWNPSAQERPVTVRPDFGADWKWSPAGKTVTIAGQGMERVAFTIEKAVVNTENRYPVKIRVTEAERTRVLEQTVVCASAVYLKPKIDGDGRDFADAIPIAFTTEGKQTTVATCWNREWFCVCVTMEEDELTAGDVVQFAIAERTAVTPSDANGVSSRHEFLIRTAPGMFANAGCYRLLKPGERLSDGALRGFGGELEPLPRDICQVAVKRKGGMTCYECAIAFVEIPEIRPDTGREFRFSVLVWDSGTGPRDIGSAVNLQPHQKNPNAWSSWALHYIPYLFYDSKVEWGLCSSKR